VFQHIDALHTHGTAGINLQQSVRILDILTDYIHTYTHPFYSSLDFVQDYPGEQVPEPIWILLKRQ